MALRQLATGAGDGCSADGAGGSGDASAAGPSNPLGGLADALLGRPSKAHERSHELPGLGRPMPGVGGMHRPGDAAAAIAAAEGDLLSAVPGLANGGRMRAMMPPGLGPGAVADFLNPQSAAGKANGGGGAFDAAFADAFGVGAAVARPPPPASGGPLANPMARLNPSLAAFVGAARTPGAAGAFRPPPQSSQLPPPPPLAVPDACRLRDRAETLARQLGASAPQAREQVAKLLWSVGVDPARLPPPAAAVSSSMQQLQRASAPAPAAASSSVAPAAWEAAWSEGGGRQQMQHPAAAAEAAAAARAAAERLGASGGAWANEFSSRLDLGGGGRGHHHRPPLVTDRRPDAWASEFAAGRPPAEAWAADFSAQQQQQQQQQERTASASSSDAAANADAREQSRALAEALGSDPKMRSSKFLSFVSKMSRGEIVLEGNEAKPASAAAVGGAWAEQHSAEQFDGAWREASTADAWATQHHHQQQQNQQQKQFQTPTQRDWADQFAAGVAPQGLADQWASEFEARRRNGGGGFGAEGIVAGVSGEEDAQQRQANNPNSSSPLLVDDGTGGPQYEFATTRNSNGNTVPNPFESDPDPLETARRLFRTGVLSEAALAAEAQIQRSASLSGGASAGGDADEKALAAWRLLGAIHAENDDDRQAIAALRRAHAAAPGDGDVLLSLGVSHTNELDRGRALAHLAAWLRRAHPEAAARHLPPVEAQQSASLPSQAVTLEAATAAFEAAAASAPPASSAAADASAALGVLRSLGRDFEGAAAAFRRALDARPDDYSLWNKLGATLANAGRAHEAAAAYRKALDAKPNYVRAWTNMGIASANLGDYLASSRYYARALALNPRAASVWGYLRTSLACAGRADLLEAADAEDAAAIERALPL